MSTTPATLKIRPIGTVRSGEGTFELVVDSPYRAALKHLNQFSHVIVFWWAHLHDNEEDRTRLETKLPYAEGVEAGVFACRAEYRPNPIMMTVCPILSVDIDGGVVTLMWIDAADGTPLVDLKPYIPMSDRIRDIHVPDWMQDWPQSMEEAAAFFADGKELGVSNGYHENDEQQRIEPQKEPGIDMGLAIALSLTLGSGMGVVFDDFGIGMIVSLSIGMIIALISERQRNKQRANIALAIMLAGLGIAFLILYDT